MQNCRSLHLAQKIQTVIGSHPIGTQCDVDARIQHTAQRHHTATKLEIADGFYPRLGYLTAGDKFTTNCLSYDDGEFSNDEAVETAYENGTELFGGVCENGTILVSKTAPVEGPVLRAAKGMGAGSLADGQFGMKFHVVKA